jgi:hypothetical protein
MEMLKFFILPGLERQPLSLPAHSQSYLIEVAYYGTNEADHETWMQSSPIKQATVLVHPPAGTHATPGEHLCSTGLQAAQRVTASHNLFLMPVTLNAVQSEIATLVTSQPL